MFSKGLENLIQATLEDGKLEDYEKTALIKRAEAEGVDITELEIYINSLLQRRERELEKERKVYRHQAEKERREAFGRKCPNCGAQIPPLTLKCECGYEISNTKNITSIQVLFEKIEKIQNEPINKGLFDNVSKQESMKFQRIRETIKMFPVPNTKEDIIEFLALSVPNARMKGVIFGTITNRLIILLSIVLLASVIVYIMIDDSLMAGITTFNVFVIGGAYAFIGAYNIDRETLIWNRNAQVWRAKFEQVLMKGRCMRGDSEFQKQLDYYENMLNYKKMRT